MALAAGAFALFAGLSASPAAAQSLGPDGPPPGGDADAEAGSRGSALPQADPGEPKEPERFGGLGGGAGRSRGTAGAVRQDLTHGAPGDPNESLLPLPIGSSGSNIGDSPGTQAPGVMGGRLGRAAIPQVRPGATSAAGPPSLIERRLERERQDVRPAESDERTLAKRPRLDLPSTPDDPGPEDGLTLDAAVERLLACNLNVVALRYEIPKADADVLTAGLRSNPILYADAQLVPYGHYTADRPGGSGGQPQYDVNISLPLDVSRKRAARLDVAGKARKVTEAQLQDEIRKLVEQLYTAYVNALAARETVRYGEAYLSGVSQILEEAERRRGSAQGEERDSLDEAAAELESRRDQAVLQVKQAGRTATRANRTLSQLLFLSGEEAKSLKLRGRLREVAPVPDDAWLVQAALANRPDLAAYRLGVGRAQADVRLARANRLSDIYMVYQPYTFQDGRAFGFKGTYSYGFGVNVALPVFNRNQGNIRRAETNVVQTRFEMQALEYQVTREVEDEAQDLRDTIDAVHELERKTLPAARRARDAAFRAFQSDPSKAGDFLGEQQDFDDVVQQYRNALIELRQDMLDLNTSTGVRIFP
ncbi:MAG: hypothetical protein BGO49_17595 [Planctomycetales bacterium 71-10]|nr:MAG: hypothetical protein BGO49_17595 [Planctomycetales bacterium 71-10]